MKISCIKQLWQITLNKGILQKKIFNTCAFLVSAADCWNHWKIMMWGTISSEYSPKYYSLKIFKILKSFKNISRLFCSVNNILEYFQTVWNFLKSLRTFQTDLKHCRILQKDKYFYKQSLKKKIFHTYI